jgi:hypothetical protein
VTGTAVASSQTPAASHASGFLLFRNLRITLFLT